VPKNVLLSSEAAGKAGRLSDVDLAVYFYPPDRQSVQFEEGSCCYPGENQIWGDLQRILKKEVELLVLNRVPATIAASAIRGLPLYITDWGLYLDFMEIITEIAEDFRDEIIRDYKERTGFEKRNSNQAY